jgi:hypothetical protein
MDMAILMGDVTPRFKSKVRLKGADMGVLREMAFKRDKYKCQAANLARGVKCYSALELDHIIPRGRGGNDTLDNVWALCTKCHTVKHGEPWAATVLGLYGMKARENLDPSLNDMDVAASIFWEAKTKL